MECLSAIRTNGDKAPSNPCVRYFPLFLNTDWVIENRGNSYMNLKMVFSKQKVLQMCLWYWWQDQFVLYAFLPKYADLTKLYRLFQPNPNAFCEPFKICTDGPLLKSRVTPLDRLLPLSLGSSGWFSQYMSYEDTISRHRHKSALP